MYISPYQIVVISQQLLISDSALFAYPVTTLLPRMDDKVFYVVSFCAAVSLPLIWKWRRAGAKLPLPPGPKGLPLLGNVLDIPRGVPMWQTFTSITRKYGACVPSRVSPNLMEIAV